jgi:type IV pilus assembly protein PilC
VSLLVIITVVVWVIPRFSQVFQGFGIPLPAITRALLAISDAVVTWWYLVFGVPLLLVVVHVLAMRRRGRYRRVMHGIALRLPLLGAVLSQAQISSFARMFGTLVQAGVPHLDALAISRDTASNEVVVEAVEEVRRVVREGEGIARPMEASGVFDPLVVSMVEVGEQTGELDRMLLRVADAYDKQVTRRVDAFFKVLEPALLIVIAAFVAVVVVALFLPLLKLMDGIGGA